MAMKGSVMTVLNITVEVGLNPKLAFFVGSSLLLQRVLVKNEIREDMTFIALDSEANLCASTYVSCMSLFYC